MKFSVLSLLFASFGLAFAKTSGGDIAVTVNGMVINPANDDDVKLQNLAPGKTILIRGIHMQFDLDVQSMSVNNFILTGASDPLRLVTTPTMILLQRAPILPTPLTNIVLSQIEVRLDKAVLTFMTNLGKIKFQIIDSAQGGILQDEPEFTTNTQLNQTLGPTIFYFINPNTGGVNMGNGIGPVTSAQDPVNFHNMFLGKDTPEAATKTLQTGTQTMFNVQPGGRVGLVFGEDALEAGVPNNCTSMCQNQDMIHGSIPIPPEPTTEVPIPGRR